MKCQNCQRENQAGARFCVHCGATIPVENPAAVAPPPATCQAPNARSYETREPDKTPTSNASALKPLLGGLAAAAIVGALIGGGFLLGTSDRDNGSGAKSADDSSAVAVVEPPGASTEATPTATAPPLPTATVVLADRASCGEIQGTAYRSEAERLWYEENCLATATPTTRVTHATLLLTGDCYNGPSTGLMGFVTIVPCHGPYDFIILYQFRVPTDSDDYPGSDYLQEQGRQHCPSGTDLYVRPSEANWNKGHRTLSCSQCNLCESSQSRPFGSRRLIAVVS